MEATSLPNPEDTMSPRHRSRSGVLLLVALTVLVPALARAQGIEEPRIPLRTALNEIHTLREAYAEAYNKKDAATLTAMYEPDAVVIRPDGTLLGRAAIGKALSEESASWTQTTFASDTTRVFGHTAWDVGTLSSSGADGGQVVTHFLVVLRRGLEDWRIASVAVVPETKAVAAH
jgi:ketosteroid isomerase-like protein